MHNVRVTIEWDPPTDVHRKLDCPLKWQWILPMQALQKALFCSQPLGYLVLPRLYCTMVREPFFKFRRKFLVHTATKSRRLQGERYNLVEFPPCVNTHRLSKLEMFSIRNNATMTKVDWSAEQLPLWSIRTWQNSRWEPKIHLRTQCNFYVLDSKAISCAPMTHFM